MILNEYLGIIGPILGGLFVFYKIIDKRIDKLEKKFDERFEKLDGKLEKVEESIKDVRGDIGNLKTELAVIKDRISPNRLEGFELKEHRKEK